MDKWRDRFDLFRDDKPFYQMASLATKKPISVNRLATEYASGNNVTLFDHSGDDVEVEWSPAQATKKLIACQSFALGFGKRGKATINGVDEELPYSTDAIALRCVSVWLQGKSLFETLMINLDLVSSEDSSLPPWELENSIEYRDRLQGKGRKSVKASGVVDHLTWQSRLVRLISKNSTISQMYFTQGRSADKFSDDPMKVYRTSKKEEKYPLSLSSGKAAWRDSHSILMIPNAKSKERRPECFNLVARAHSAAVINTSQPFVTHIVGLATVPKKAGKFLLWRHERLPIPAALLSDVNLIERLGLLIENAEHAAARLKDRTMEISKLYLSPNCKSLSGRQPDKGDVTKIVEAIDPRPAYWARLEEHFFKLLANLSNDWDPANEAWKPDDQQAATRAWRKHIKREAEWALQESIRALGTTARAIQAIARVRTDFNDKDLSSPPQTVANNKRTAKGGKKK
nr:type I-E CRISPR-associated protein Cse1/CasA [Candidatus Hakubella thermalkaliphila]